MRNRWYAITIFMLFLVISASSVAQNSQVTFGQNRVQYHDFDWLFYDSDNFTTYYYPGGQEIGEFAIITAERELARLEEDLDFRAAEKVNIIVYNDITDLAQTNIGLGNEAYNLGGTTRVFDNKIFIYFDGSHENLLKEIRKGIASVYVRSALTGNFFQEIMSSTAFFSIPEWFEKGLASYIGQHWNTELDEQLRGYVLKVKKGSFANLARINPELAGHSMLYFIESLFGNDAIKNVMYLTRVNRSVSDGMRYAIGMDLETAEKEWQQFFLNRYNADTANRQTDLLADKLRIKTRKNRSFGHIALSPDGKSIAYAVYNGGAFKIMVQNLEKNKARKVGKGGFLSDNYPFDYSYPLIAWSPSGTTLGSIYEKRDKIYLNEWDAGSRKKKKPVEIKSFQRINDFCYTTDSKNIIMSVQIRGQSDIYTLNLTNMNTRAITNDIWDDAYPAYVRAGNFEGYVFSSNRPDDTLRNQQLEDILPVGKYDLFFRGLNNTSNVLDRIIVSQGINEIQSRYFDNDHFAFLSEKNGLYNQYITSLDSIYLGKDSVFLNYEEMEKDDFGNPLPGESEKKKEIEVYRIVAKAIASTDVAFNITEHSISRLTGKTAILFQYKQKPYISLLKQGTTGLEQAPANTAHQQEHLSKEQVRREQGIIDARSGSGIQPLEKPSLDSLLSGDFPYQFKSEYDNTLNKADPEVDETSDGSLSINDSKAVAEKINSEFRSSKSVAYRAKFSSDYIVTQLDNSVLLQPYQNFDVNAGTFQYPDLSGLITLGISDLMEDHKIVGGFRIPINFDGSQVFVSYQNLKKRLDYKFLFFRDSYQEDLVYNPDGTNIFIPILGKIKSHYAEASLSYPFDIVRSLKLISSYRNDRRYIALTDPLSATLPNTNENWVSFRLEYVHDNSRKLQLNILNGLRYKAYFEYMRSFEDKKGNLYNLGFDVRHYQKIYRNIIWANRVAAASSFGPAKIAYIMGGVDTWLNPDYAYDIPIDYNNGYQLQAPVNNVRGLPQNIRNGNSFFLWNTELRFPIISAFAKRTLRSSFLQNFQLVGFFDLGSAYKGFTPFDEQNPINSEQIVYQAGGVPVTIINLDYFRRPTVYGYGAGVHTSILGYFLRMDAAWGYDGVSHATKPSWLFSLSTDF